MSLGGLTIQSESSQALARVYFSMVCVRCHTNITPVLTKMCNLVTHHIRIVSVLLYSSKLKLSLSHISSHRLSIISVLSLLKKVAAMIRKILH